MQGDFNEQQTPSQVIANAGISITLSTTGVGVVAAWLLDFRDFCACVYLIYKDGSKSGSFKPNEVSLLKWLLLVIMMVGLVPALGDLLKGVLRIVYLQFMAISKTAGNLPIAQQFDKAIDASMPYIKQLLGHEQVRKYLSKLGWHRPFKELAQALRKHYADITNVKGLITIYDKKIEEFKQIFQKIKDYLPSGAEQKYNELLKQLQAVRDGLNQKASELLKPLQDCVDSLIIKLEKEDLATYRAISGRFSSHYYGRIDSKTKAFLESKKLPFLKKTASFPALEITEFEKTKVRKKAKEGYPNLFRKKPWDETQDYEYVIATFSKKGGMQAVQLTGPMRLYRVIAPAPKGSEFGEFWITEKVFKQLKSRDDWRDRLAVKVDWSANGQYVTYDIKAGETLKVWRGPAASQKFDKHTDLWYQGGTEQIVFFPDPAKVSKRAETGWGYIDNDKQLLNNRIIINLDGTAKK
ncbi:hypothetical protein IM753_12080 [Moraxella sp. K127]|uniref:hypothetical protein n=1 Tax=Moraxella sp. K127 TaxID=2780079 RepID=UPI00187F4167|nr:hypothetical protein [Moraxella sp. K127]MBE9591692.1 hypothetical protein [Moraxella sp. K127]